MIRFCLSLFGTLLLAGTLSNPLHAGTKTWDGRHDTGKIEVTVVYFVPADRTPLRDWRERVDYYCRRIRLFHEREFQGLSKLETKVHAEPLVSNLTTAELRKGDANAIFFRTLRESDARLKFAAKKSDAFPILLVLSEINWRPLDDFYRLQPKDGALVFEGNYSRGEHFPGAASGGARATYIANRGVGWGLVSADGWRVPYRGSDCVIYHEGCGHTVGLPHPEPGNGSVMSLGQYRGWLSESWLDRDQKSRLKWEPQDFEASPEIQLFSQFRALAQPRVPLPGQPVTLALDWPEGVNVQSLRVRYQTSINGPWVDVAQTWDGATPNTAVLGSFDRPTPVSYRVDAKLKNGAAAELWGYFQVRANPRLAPQPGTPSVDISPAKNKQSENASKSTSIPRERVRPYVAEKEVDLIAMADLKTCWRFGPWSKDGGRLTSGKGYGTRIELPFSPPQEYRLVLIVEPLDAPNGLILGQYSGDRRFVTLFNYLARRRTLSAIEDVDGRNVGNPTTHDELLFRRSQLSQVVVTVLKDRVTMSVDGRTIVDWKGSSERLSLSEYWKTPRDNALFIGTYDCGYRFHRITLEPITGSGKRLTPGPQP